MSGRLLAKVRADDPGAVSVAALLDRVRTICLRRT